MSVTRRHRTSAALLALALLATGCGPVVADALPDSGSVQSGAAIEAAGGTAAAAGGADGGPASAPSADPAKSARAAASTASWDTTVPPGTTVTSVAPDGDGLLLAGGDEAGPAIYAVEPDGQPVRQTVTGGRGARVEAVAADDATGIAVGTDADGALHTWRRQADGTWRAVDDDAGLRGRVTAVAVSQTRWVAVGDLVDPEGGEAYDGVVWESRDGAWFSEIDPPVELAEGTLTDVAVAGDTTVVVGFDVKGGRALVRTGDGALRAADGDFSGTTLHGVAATQNGFVIVGRGIGDLAPRLWTSTDGRAWRATDFKSADVAPDEELHDAATAGNDVIVVGGGPAGAAVWRLRGARLDRLS